MSGDFSNFGFPTPNVGFARGEQTDGVESGNVGFNEFLEPSSESSISNLKARLETLQSKLREAIQRKEFAYQQYIALDNRNAQEHEYWDVDSAYSEADEEVAVLGEHITGTQNELAELEANIPYDASGSYFLG